MEFGNFKIQTLFICLLILFGSLQAQEPAKTSDFLYKQLDLFLQKPTTSSLLKLSKMTASKEGSLRSKDDHLAWVILNCNTGYYQNQFGNASGAILYYEKAWKTYQHHRLSDYDIIENCLQPLGNLYLKIGDLTKAENTITSYLYLAEQANNKPKIIAAITNLSIAYHNKGGYKKAIQILNKGLEIDPQNTNLLNNLATNYIDSKNFNQAEGIANKILSNDTKQVNAYQILARVSLAKKDFFDAQKYMNLAKSILVEKPGTSTRDIAKLQLAFTDILVAASSFDQAEASLKEVYATLLPDYDITENLPNEEHLIADQILLKALDLHSYVFERLEKPNEAIKSYELAFQVNAKLNELYPLQNTKILQHSQQRIRTEAYIELLFNLFQTSKNNDLITKAFRAIEQSKAPFVSEALFSKNILASYKNDSLVIKKNEIDEELSVLETQILKEKLKGDQADIATIQKWLVSYNTKSTGLSEISGKLKEKYPLLLKTLSPISIKELQHKMTEDHLDVLIEYFYGNRFIYQFEIHQKSFRLKRIRTKNQIESTIVPYIKLFDKPSNITDNIPEYTQRAFNTYTQLKLPEEVSTMLIIPDGILNFIPFEALLTQPTQTLNFGKMPFLLKSSRISYEISANKYVHSTTPKVEKKSVLGMFPVFENSTLELPFSKEENTSIQQYVDGEFLTRKDATYANLVQKAPDHNIIHLSTHAESGNFVQPASLKFIDQDILVTQLYGLDLSADLVVLSACETGVGKLAKGEGPLSIARGFQYAGANNLLFSLWKVNDRSTSILMKGFYKNLSQPKVEALHQSKLNYLSDKNISNTQKSPYYWSAFVYYGDLTTFNSLSEIWKYLIIALCIVFVLLLHKLRQNNK